MLKAKGNRRLMVTVSLLLILGLLAACGGNTGSSPSSNTGTSGDANRVNKDSAPPAPDVKPYEGVRITAYMGNTGTADVIKELLPEFEARTGMKVELQSFANDQLSQKLTVQLTSGSAEPDVAMIRPLEEVKLFNRNGWMMPLDEFVNQNPDYDYADISKASLESTTAEGKLLAIPMVTEQQILYYRKDLLENAGIPVPTTLDELEAAAGKLHDPKSDLYGFVARGQRGALVTQLSSFLFSEGGDFQQGDIAAVNTPEAIKGMTRYVNLLKNYGPQGVLNMGWPQALGVFSQGKAVFFTDTSSILPSVIDTEQSTVVDQIGFAQFPAGAAGSKPYNITAWALMMNAKTPNKEAVWAFMEWATSKEIITKAQKIGVPGARTSVWDDPNGNTGFPEQFIAVVQESIKVAVGHDRPKVISVGQARDIIGDVVVKGLLNEDIQAAADKANEDFQALIDKDNNQ